MSSWDDSGARGQRIRSSSRQWCGCSGRTCPSRDCTTTRPTSSGLLNPTYQEYDQSADPHIVQLFSETWTSTRALCSSLAPEIDSLIQFPKSVSSLAAIDSDAERILTSPRGNQLIPSGEISVVRVRSGCSSSTWVNSTASRAQPASYGAVWKSAEIHTRRASTEVYVVCTVSGLSVESLEHHSVE